MDLKKKKRIVIFAFVAVLLLMICFSILIIKNIENIDLYEKELDSYGSLAPIIFILSIIIQVFIPFIPGEPFELVGGYLFGEIFGSLICFIAGSIASIVIVILTRKYGTKIIKLFFDEKEYDKLKFLNSKKSHWIYVLLFVLPGTPKDLLCYYGGLTSIDIKKLLFLVTFGRIPSIITSTIPASLISQDKYLIGFLILGVCVVLAIIGAFIYKKYISK